MILRIFTESLNPNFGLDRLIYAIFARRWPSRQVPPSAEDPALKSLFTPVATSHLPPSILAFPAGLVCNDNCFLQAKMATKIHYAMVVVEDEHVMQSKV